VAKLPIDLSGREVRAALERAGFVFRRQSGSHMILRRDEPHARVVVPDHKQIRAGNRLQQGQRYAASTSSEARKTRTLRPSKSSRIATRSRSSMPS